MIIALLFYDGDVEPSMSLARLLADIEPTPRDDVLLAFCSQPGTTRSGLVSRTINHCARKFPVTEVTSPLGAHGHPEGCTALWTGTCRHFCEISTSWWSETSSNNLLTSSCHHSPLTYDTNTWHNQSLLTLDANDVVPLHPDWIAITLNLHEETLRQGKLITGTPYFLGECPLHVNPNAVFELSVFGRTKILVDVPKYDGTVRTNFDVYHREEMLAHAHLSSFARTDWRGGGEKITSELIEARSRGSVLLHGYKDKDIYWKARAHLSKPCTRHLDLRYYDLDNLRLHERVRRDYEESLR